MGISPHQTLRLSLDFYATIENIYIKIRKIICLSIIKLVYLQQKQKYFMMEKFNEIINSNQLTLVDFYATWCGPCRMMHPVLEQLKEQLGDNIRIIKLDVDKNQGLSMNYRVQSVPTLMLFRNGNVLWRQSGAMNLSDLMSLIRQYQ